MNERRRSYLDILKDSYLLSPYDLLRNLERELENLNSGLGNYIWGGRECTLKLSKKFSYPNVDIFDKGHEFLVTVELPGCDKEDIELNISETQIEIKAESDVERRVVNRYWVKEEVKKSRISKTILLPDKVIPEKAKATFECNVLEVRVPKKSKEMRKERIMIE